MIGAGFFLSDLGVRLKNERILCCFFDLGVELIISLFFFNLSEKKFSHCAEC